jgi:hypothetical protein
MSISRRQNSAHRRESTMNVTTIPTSHPISNSYTLTLVGGTCSLSASSF